ncbi:hypothetical protein IPF29_06465, partial [Francisella tularensis]
AFLLDIITFLQISFSTNIFRINYIYDISKYQNISYLKYSDIASKYENITNEQLRDILGSGLDYDSIAFSKLFTSNILHLVIGSPNSWEIFDISGFIDSIKCINQYQRNIVVCKNLLVDVNYYHPLIEPYYFINSRIYSLNVT